MKKVIDGKMYDTEKAEELSNTEFSDGSNRMNVGRASHLYKTKNGAYFTYRETCWQGEHDSIDPVSPSEAEEIFEGMRNQNVEWEDAFGKKPIEA